MSIFKREKFCELCNGTGRWWIGASGDVGLCTECGEVGKPTSPTEAKRLIKEHNNKILEKIEKRKIASADKFDYDDFIF